LNKVSNNFEGSEILDDRRNANETGKCLERTNYKNFQE
jgi:hypothetical protein